MISIYLFSFDMDSLSKKANLLENSIVTLYHVVVTFPMKVYNVKFLAKTFLFFEKGKSLQKLRDKSWPSTMHVLPQTAWTGNSKVKFKWVVKCNMKNCKWNSTNMELDLAAANIINIYCRLTSLLVSYCFFSSIYFRFEEIWFFILKSWNFGMLFMPRRTKQQTSKSH